MRNLAILIVLVSAVAANAAGLQTIMTDDFSGDLSKWDLSWINAPSSGANSVSINSSDQMVINAGSGSNVRGFLMTALGVGGSSDDLISASGAANGDVIMRVQYDIISANSPYSGGLLFGAGVIGTGAGEAGGTKIIDAVSGSNGAGAIGLWYGGSGGNTYYTDAGYNGTVSGWSTGTSHIGTTIRFDWINNYSGGAIPVCDRLEIYLNGSLATSVDTSQVGWSAEKGSAVGFYMLLDRDVVIDNFSLQAVPEPATMALLSIGLAGLLSKRR